MLILDETATAVVCTFSQAMMDWSKGIPFDPGTIDDITVMHERQLMMGIRDYGFILYLLMIKRNCERQSCPSQ